MRPSAASVEPGRLRSVCIVSSCQCNSLLAIERHPLGNKHAYPIHIGLSRNISTLPVINHLQDWRPFPEVWIRPSTFPAALVIRIPPDIVVQTFPAESTFSPSGTPFPFRLGMEHVPCRCSPTPQPSWTFSIKKSPLNNYSGNRATGKCFSR